ncbi:MAG: hypothetical protein IKR42_01930, partial [Campylobacter sp.]|nr:hypothetical protein [Campylobacter sp.]
MPLFKEKIIKEQKQDEKTLNERYENLLKFQAKIEQIKDFKEEVYQTDFLHDIFEACLGYTLKTSNPAKFNLQRESKNETDSKKADGAILDKNGEVIGVIELKSYTTRNLDKVEEQAFGYHRKNKKSKYIITSNFDRIRLYIDNAVNYEEFSLFEMTREKFEFFHLVLSYENLINGTTLKLKEDSENADRDISKKLYNDFAEFRLKLFDSAVSNNQNLDKKQILSLVQKLCDRIIFVLFAEDKGLLKYGFVKDINTEWQNRKFGSESLYRLWQNAFKAIDEGNADLQIPAYNGGLFATDEALNSLKFDDEILQIYTKMLSEYDFNSEVSVNILGHIFEQSLSDLQELIAGIDNQKFDKKDSKRKKDGIFYTPEYITKFIVEQTLGKICQAKKDELKFDEEIILPKKTELKSLIKSKYDKNLKQKELEQLYIRKRKYEKADLYSEFLLNLKIIDPACGSGAFLNQALEFLIKEHAFADKHRRVLEDEALPYYDIEPQILENNL